MDDSVETLVNDLVASRHREWELARDAVHHWLDAHCSQALGPGADPSRLDVGSARIKEPVRIVDKIRRKCAGGRAAPPDPEAVERMVTDLVATKVLCKSTRDQSLLWTHLETQSEGDIQILERRDYVAAPKESGYRAMHMLLEVPVANCAPVVVELQIKTRLQDAWGELTHEDLYKPGRALTPQAFHQSVGLSMANLLAEVDRLADQLAEEMSAAVDPEDDGSTVEREEDPGQEVVTVRATGPRYALAVDGDGNDGIILASDVRRFVGASSLVDVSDHLHRGDRITVIPQEGDRGRYLKLVSLPGHVQE